MFNNFFNIVPCIRYRKKRLALFYVRNVVFLVHSHNTELPMGLKNDKRGNVRVTQQWGAFVQPLLQGNSNNCYIF
jgi:hypothetical protein